MKKISAQQKIKILDKFAKHLGHFTSKFAAGPNDMYVTDASMEVAKVLEKLVNEDQYKAVRYVKSQFPGVDLAEEPMPDTYGGISAKAAGVGMMKALKKIRNSIPAFSMPFENVQKFRSKLEETLLDISQFELNFPTSFEDIEKVKVYTDRLKEIKNKNITIDPYASDTELDTELRKIEERSKEMGDVLRSPGFGSATETVLSRR